MAQERRLDFRRCLGHHSSVKPLCIAILAGLLCLTAQAEDWTVNGKIYHNVVVGIVEADRVHVTYDGGVGTVNISDLPPDVQKRLGYDPQKAALTQQLHALEMEISDLKAENARLRDELLRYKAAAGESKATAGQPPSNVWRPGDPPPANQTYEHQNGL
jgi:hypothetical protein